MQSAQVARMVLMHQLWQLAREEDCRLSLPQREAEPSEGTPPQHFLLPIGQEKEVWMVDELAPLEAWVE